MNYIFETINCNICGSDDYQQVSEKGKFGLPTNVVLCKECGLGYLNPRWNKASYLHFYRYEYDKYYRFRILNDRVALQPNNPILKRLEKLKLFPENVQHILDIGSGGGGNLKNFQSIFPDSNLYAIEPSMESQKQLNASGVKIVADDVESPWDNEYQDKFEVIIMRHVLEHFMNPVQVMKKVRRVLSSSGILYLAVPNNLNPVQNLENSWFRNVHTFYFNRYSLGNLMKRSNMEVLQLIEGDKYNQGEVYLVAKKSYAENSPGFSREHYQKQLSVFKNKLKQDRNLINRIAFLIRKIIRLLQEK